MYQESSQRLLCKSFPISGLKHFQVRRGRTPRTGAAPAVCSRRGRQQAWKLAGCCPHAVGIRKSRLRRHQDGQAPSAVGRVRGKVPHLPGRDSALPSLSSAGLGSAGRQERVPKGERIGLSHLLDKEQRNLTPLAKSMEKFRGKAGKERIEKKYLLQGKGTQKNRDNPKGGRKK